MSLLLLVRKLGGVQDFVIAFIILFSLISAIPSSLHLSTLSVYLCPSRIPPPPNIFHPKPRGLRLLNIYKYEVRWRQTALTNNPLNLDYERGVIKIYNFIYIPPRPSVKIDALISSVNFQLARCVFEFQKHCDGIGREESKNNECQKRWHYSEKWASVDVKID